MTISSSGSSVTYAGNDITTTFAFPYDYQDGADFVVVVTVTATGVATKLDYQVDYRVNPATNSPATNGSIIAVTPVASGSTITITRVTPLTQETEWQENDAYPANFNRVENALDKLTLALQEQVDGGTITDAGLGTGNATYSNFLRGAGPTPNDQRVWSYTLVGPLGALTDAPPTDTQTLFEVQQAAAAAIKVTSGIGAQGSFRYAVDGDTNAWAAQWVYDPNLGKLGYQFYGGSILATFDNAGGADFTGTVNANLFTGAADASLITTGLIPTARLGSGAASSATFLRGDQTWAVVSGGGGGINTTTTGTFTIAAVNSTQTVPVTSATGIVAGTELIIGDGTHQITGLVTVVASLNLTVKTQAISLGIAGNTMASGAAVQSGTLPGNNTVEVQDDAAGPFNASNIHVVGNSTEGFGFGSSTLAAFISSFGGGSAIIQPYAAAGTIKPESVFHGGFTSDPAGIVAAQQASIYASYLCPTAVAQSLLCTGFSGGKATTIAWGLVGASNITPASLTPALLNLTNSLTNNQLFGYDSASGHFKMFAPGISASGTAAQLINGAGTATNTLALSGGASLILSDTGTNSLTIGGPGSIPTLFTVKTAASGSSPDLTSLFGFQSPFWAGNVLSLAAIDTLPAYNVWPVEGALVQNWIRATEGVRTAAGAWTNTVLHNAPSSSVTIDVNTSAYHRFTSLANDVAVTITDTTPVPSNSAYRYAGELTVELVAPTTFNMTFAASSGSITWAAGASAPSVANGQFSSSGTNIVRFVRRQGVSGWVGYVENTISAGSGTVTSITAGAGLSGGTITTSGTIAIGTASVVQSMIAAGAVGNTEFDATDPLQVSKLQNWGSSGGLSTVYLNAAGTWTVPPGTGGGGGGGNVFLANTQTFTGSNTFSNKSTSFTRTFGSLSSSVITSKLCNLYPEVLYQDANAIDLTITDNYATPPGGGGVGAMYVNHQVNSRTGGGESVHLNVNLKSTLTSGFNIGLTQITQSKRLNGGYADSIWLNSWGPDSNFSATPDADGIVHEFNTGVVRIGEVNYGNAWADFGMATRGSSPRWVVGMEFFPDWLEGSTGDPAVINYNASWGIGIGGAPAGAGGGLDPKNWKGLYVVHNGIVGKNDHPAIADTTTTSTFVIATAGATQTVPVTSVGDIGIGTYVQINDGSHTVMGHVTGAAGLSLTVTTDVIVVGSVGNTMASGAGIGPIGDTVGGGGYALDLHGSSASGNPIGKAVNIAGYVDVGIDLSSATFTDTGTSKGQQAICLADAQSIKLGPIWLRGHTVTGTPQLQYSTDGTNWSNITLP